MATNLERNLFLFSCEHQEAAGQPAGQTKRFGNLKLGVRAEQDEKKERERNAASVTVWQSKKIRNPVKGHHRKKKERSRNLQFVVVREDVGMLEDRT